MIEHVNYYNVDTSLKLTITCDCLYLVDYTK